MFNIFTERALLSSRLSERFSVKSDADRKTGGNPHQVFSSGDVRYVVCDGFDRARGRCSTVNVREIANFTIGCVKKVPKPRSHHIGFGRRSRRENSLLSGLAIGVRCVLICRSVSAEFLNGLQKRGGILRKFV